MPRSDASLASGSGTVAPDHGGESGGGAPSARRSERSLTGFASPPVAPSCTHASAASTPRSRCSSGCDAELFGRLSFLLSAMAMRFRRSRGARHTAASSRLQRSNGSSATADATREPLVARPTASSKAYGRAEDASKTAAATQRGPIRGPKPASSTPRRIATTSIVPARSPGSDPGRVACSAGVAAILRFGFAKADPIVRVAAALNQPSLDLARDRRRLQRDSGKDRFR